LLLGAPLFEGTTELEILSNLHSGELTALDRAQYLPADLRAVLRRALSPQPRARYASARDFSFELERVARAHGESLGSHEFAQWLADLGLIALKSGVTLKRDVPSSLAPEVLPANLEGPPTLRVLGASKAGLHFASAGSLADSLRQFASGEPQRVVARPPSAAPDITPSPLPAANDTSLPWYRIRRPGGTIVGPLSLARLLEMVATARAGADTEVSRSGGPFMSVSAVNELTRLASRPLFRFFDPIALFASERHAIEPSSLAWHLFRYVATRKTGLVSVRNGRDQLRLYFVAGVPAASASTDPEDLLGNCVLRAGLTSREALEQALETGHRQGKSLGQSLLDEGLVDPSDLLACVAQQRARRVAALLRFREGDLCFVDGVASGEESLALPPSATAFMALAVRAAYTHEELLALLSGLPNEPLACRPILHLQRGTLGLTPEEAHTFDRVAAGVPPSLLLAQAKKQGPEAEKNALTALFLGLSCGAFSVQARR